MNQPTALMDKIQRDAHVDRNIDSALSLGLEHQQSQAILSFLDKVVRPAMKWINDQEAEGHDADEMWRGMVSGCANIMGEAVLRLNRRDDIKGGIELAQRMVNLLSQNLSQNIEINFHPPRKEGN